jgi:arylformamidase
VFALWPLVPTSVNDVLGLDGPQARALSPLLLPGMAAATPPVVVAWADGDTDAFRAQAVAYAARLAAEGVQVARVHCPGRHHFDVVDDLADPATALGAATLAVSRPPLARRRRAR